MRTARWNVSGVSYHLIWRFVDRGWFFREPAERAMYLRLLGRALAASDWRLLAYALMSNHIHLHAVAGEQPMSSWTKRVNSPFVRWMNDKHGRLGSILAGRARDFAVLPENEGALISYIHNNPVRAGLVENAAGSTWTSHRAYLGLDASPPWLHVAEGMSRARIPTSDAFADFVRAGTCVGRDEFLTLRSAMRPRGTFAAGPAISTVTTAPVLARPFSFIRPAPDRLVRLAADAASVSLEDVCSRRRAPAIVSARRIAARLARYVGVSGSDLAAALAMSPQGLVDAARHPLSETEERALERAVERLRFETGG